MTEVSLYEQVAAYMALKHPDLVPLCHFDLAGVNNPSRYTRALYGRLNRRAWPDWFLAKPMFRPHAVDVYGGLFLELKREGTRLRLRNGAWATGHIAEQAEQLERLAEQGYVAQFAVGFDEAVQLIESYLDGCAWVPAGGAF